MRKILEFIRAAIVITALPVLLLFFASSSHTWVVLGAYVVAATVALPILNALLKEGAGQDSKDSQHKPSD
jgi:predicted lysophospholipase L1 biosynthesis ABC-type transport system permease subunit